jgi:cytoskeleton protein RodZ
MSEETPTLPSDPLAEPAKVRLALGAALRNTRERLKLDVETVAQQLKMSAFQVTALEQDNHAVLPAPTFVRGFIRNYARLLQMDAVPLLDAYKQMLPDSQNKNSISLKLESIPITSHAQKSFRLYLLVSFFLIIIGGGWWQYMEWNEKKAKPNIAKMPVPISLPNPVIARQPEPSLAPEPIPQMQSFVAQTPPATAKPPVVEKPPVPAAEATKPPATIFSPEPEADSLHMTFSEQTWVSVTDATGKQVFNKTKAPNTEDTAEGTPPFKVVIGNAAGVQMFYKDQPVDITSHTKANVSHLTVP